MFNKDDYQDEIDEIDSMKTDISCDIDCLGESEVEDDHSYQSLKPQQEFEENKPVHYQDSGSNKKDQNMINMVFVMKMMKIV